MVEGANLNIENMIGEDFNEQEKDKIERIKSLRAQRRKLDGQDYVPFDDSQIVRSHEEA